jgi:hypothetical protein
MVQAYPWRGRLVNYFTVRDDLPVCPAEMLNLVYESVAQQRNLKTFQDAGWKYEYMDVVLELDDWLKKHVSTHKPWGVQVLQGTVPIHKDWNHGGPKLIFLVQCGNDQVETVWFNEQKNVELARICLAPNRWYELAVSINHMVCGLELTQQRIAIIQRR